MTKVYVVTEIGFTIKTLIEVGYSTFFGWAFAVITITTFMVFLTNQLCDNEEDEND